MSNQLKLHPLLKVLFVSLTILGLAGCASPDKSSTVSRDEGVMNPPVVLPAKVTAVGYGAMPTQEGLSPAQRRLLSMRAAKLDAYRALAETVSGVKITGNSTVSALALNNDGFRVYIESYLRGARVVTVTPLPDGAFETTLELTLGGDFYRAAAQQAASNHDVATPAAPAAAPMKAVPQPVAQPAVQPVAARVDESQNFYLSL